MFSIIVESNATSLISRNHKFDFTQTPISTTRFSIRKLLVLLLLFVVSACGQKQAPEAQTEAIETVAEEIKPSVVEFPKQDYLTRNIKDEIFYFVMPDRFHNGKPKNDEGDPTKPISFGGLDTTSKWAFHGGDIHGLETKLDYIESLGVTAIWLTPILRNRAIQDDGFGHHGYWVIDFTEIDPHFGSNDDLKSLIAEAHKRDIKIFFDIITNHTADVIKYKECHDESGKFLNSDQKNCAFISTQELAQGKHYTPFTLESEKDIKVPAWLNDPKYYNNRGDSFWQGESAIKGDFVGLDDIDTSQTAVVDGLTQIFKDLISEFRPDGFRIDTVKHVDIEFWQDFGPAITAHAQSIGLPEFFIFGEVYDGDPAGLSKFTTEGKLPSVLDFGFAFNSGDVIFRNKSVSQFTQLFDNDDYYRDGDSSPNDLLNFISNHDIGRVGHFIQQSLPQRSAKNHLQRTKIAHAFMYMSRGVPVVYYGDEQGFTGDGGDVDARENMDPSKVESYNDNILLGTDKTTADDNFDRTHPLYTYFTELAQIRHKYKSLRHGIHINRVLDEPSRIYGFSRIMPEDMQDHLVIFNFSDTAQQISLMTGNLEYEVLAGNQNNTVDLSGDQLLLGLQPQSYILLQSKTAIFRSRVQNISMGSIYQENGRVFIPFDVTFNNPEQLNIARIDVFGVNQNGEKMLIAYDTTPPYRAILLPSQTTQLTTIEVQASNYKGQTISKTFDINTKM